MEREHTRILVIDDEKNVRELLEIGLRGHGFAVVSAADGSAALRVLRDAPVDAVVCDVMLPKIDGISLLPELRRLTEAPIIMLSAKSDVGDRIVGLEGGADDYMAKPYSLDELVARIATALRRPTLRHRTMLRYADLDMDLDTRTVMRSGREIDLSTREFDLLAFLLRSPRQVFTREQLLERVWGLHADVGPGSVETYISYLRSKVDQKDEPRLIHTVRGAGYSLR